MVYALYERTVPSVTDLIFICAEKSVMRIELARKNYWSTIVALRRCAYELACNTARDHTDNKHANDKPGPFLVYIKTLANLRTHRRCSRYVKQNFKNKEIEFDGRGNRYVKHGPTAAEQMTRRLEPPLVLRDMSPSRQEPSTHIVSNLCMMHDLHKRVSIMVNVV